MALVNRAPYGLPTHSSVSTPQNAAWFSALQNAKHTVYIVSPTLNASPLIPAIIAACERGVNVHCYVCLSYNDAVSQPPLALLPPNQPLPDHQSLTKFPRMISDKKNQGELVPR